MENTEPSFQYARWSLKGMTALVTGGTSGIGFVITNHNINYKQVLNFFFLNTLLIDSIII